jgi:thioredoxin reductase (NADPH)
MISAEQLRPYPIFKCLEADHLDRLAAKAADVRLKEGEWLIREGEQPWFFVLLEGKIALLKDMMGRQQEITQYKVGEFFGEVPMLLGAPAFASMQARSEARVARFDRGQLQELIQSSAACSALILQTMTNRLMSVQQYAQAVTGPRVFIVGSQYDVDCRDIRTFLSANRIPYEWVDRGREPERVPSCMPADLKGPAVVVDRDQWLRSPTVGEVAKALGLNTQPKHTEYDVVIAGAGPAGLAAGVYGASEGLRVLMVEKAAPGGQAGTSSRIENYLGFPGGLSGDELTERALKQADKFGAEIVMTREIEAVEPLEGGYCVQLKGGDRVSAKVVILATGVAWRRLEAEGIERLQGKGVLYGASRQEASSVAGKPVYLVGGGNSAGQAAVFFANYASEVTMLVRGEKLELTMSQYLIGQIAGKANIHVEPYTEVIAVEGDAHLERIVTRTRRPGEPESIQTRETEALFVMIGATADTSWMPRNLERDAKGYICTGRDLTTWSEAREAFPLETNLPGVFCAGDVRHDSVKRVSSGVGEGSMAIAFVHEYLALDSF